MYTAKLFKDNKRLEETNCIICHSSNYILLHDFQPFKILRCIDCNTAYLSPRLEEAEIMKIYQSDEYFKCYSENISDSYDLQKESLRLTFKQFIKILMKKKLITGGRLLEIGCAYGNFLAEVRPLFNYTAGIDFSDEAVEKAKDYADVIIKGGIEQLDLFDKDFDTIISTNVIEHVYNPHEFVSKACSKLSYNGTLILITPKFDGIWYHLLKSKWHSFKIPEHICFYNKSSMKKLFSDNGFNNIQIFSASHAFPLSVILSKFKINISNNIVNSLNIWLPDVMIIGIGMKSNKTRI
ncbi:MAG: class I SAM-dependent methyltransferase [Cyanobacteriota bacterium]